MLVHFPKEYGESEILKSPLMLRYGLTARLARVAEIAEKREHKINILCALCASAVSKTI